MNRSQMIYVLFLFFNLVGLAISWQWLLIGWVVGLIGTLLIVVSLQLVMALHDIYKRLGKIGV